ncbi:cytosolic carboxypeptidase 4-like [Arapaima gigas]
MRKFSVADGLTSPSTQGMQLGTRELEEMGAHFCRSLLSLRSSAGLHGEELMHHASALLGLEDDPQDRTSHSSFEDDEPPGEETVDYHDDWYPEQSGEELDNEIDDVSSSEEEGEGVGEDEPQRDSLGVLGRAEH